jgi:hypothetical protein
MHGPPLTGRQKAKAKRQKAKSIASDTFTLSCTLLRHLPSGTNPIFLFFALCLLPFAFIKFPATPLPAASL